jgi:hypothetical protein
MTQVFKIKDGYGLDRHIRHPGPEHEDALEQYRRDKTGPFASALLEMVAFPRIDERLEKHEAYRQAKAKNGGRDPFGPEGQPHFEIDFLVRTFCLQLGGELTCSPRSPMRSNSTIRPLPLATT